MAISPTSPIASALPDDQHGWKCIWSKQLSGLLLLHQKRLLDLCVRIKLRTSGVVEMLAVRMERDGNRRRFIHDTVDFVGQKRDHFPRAKKFYAIAPDLRVARARAIINAFPEDIRFQPIDSRDDCPGAMVMRRCPASGEPGNGKDCQGMVRFLMEQMHAEALFGVTFVVVWLEPVSGQGSALCERTNPRNDFVGVLGLAGHGAKILNIIGKRIGSDSHRTSPFRPRMQLRYQPRYRPTVGRIMNGDGPKVRRGCRWRSAHTLGGRLGGHGAVAVGGGWGWLLQRVRGWLPPGGGKGTKEA